MFAIVTTGTGGYDKMEYRQVPVPTPRTGEVLLRVLAAGVNNTDINTRLGWYASAVTGATGEADATAQANPASGWNGPTPFPLIQGVDCCGEVVKVGEASKLRPGVALGSRVLVRPCMRTAGFDEMECEWLGCSRDGAFAEYVTVPASEVFAIHCDWSDAELASTPCAYGTAANMLHKAALGAGEDVLVTGASGGVGSAAVQIASSIGGRVTAICGTEKQQRILELGAQAALDRSEDLTAALGEHSTDLVVDVVGGPMFGALLSLLRPGGRYVTAGAIAGPVVDLDLRTLYLNDLRLIGSTAWEEPVFPALLKWIQEGKLKPAIARTYPLREIAEAQRYFMEKRHVGKIVLIP